MIKKMVVVMALGVSASAATTKHHDAKQPAQVAKADPMKTVPGQNPISVAPPSAAVKNARKPKAIKDSNPMGVVNK